MLRPAVTLTLDLRNLTRLSVGRLSVGASGYSV